MLELDRSAVDHPAGGAGAEGQFGGRCRLRRGDGRPLGSHSGQQLVLLLLDGLLVWGRLEARRRDGLAQLE